MSTVQGELLLGLPLGSGIHKPEITLSIVLHTCATIFLLYTSQKDAQLVHCAGEGLLIGYFQDISTTKMLPYTFVLGVRHGLIRSPTWSAVVQSLLTAACTS